MLDGCASGSTSRRQSCVLAHVTTTLAAIERGAPVDLVFQSIAGTEAANRTSASTLALLRRGARRRRCRSAAARVGDNVMYFETGQGSALSAEAHHGVDQQTLEARAYAVARAFEPLLVNTVVGFIGPEYLSTARRSSAPGWRTISAASCSACRWGVDVCYTNHAEADQDDMDTLLTLLGVAGVQLHHGRARRRRRHAELSEHLVPRRALSARASWA